MAGALQQLVLAGRSSRSFVLGALIVVVPLALEDNGFDAAQLNMVLAAGLAGATVQMQLVGWLSRRLGRLATLALYTASIAMAGACLASSRSLVLVLLTTFIGALSLQPNISAHAPLEQATLADSAETSEERTIIFAWYNSVSTIAMALGSLFVSFPIPGGVRSQIAVCCVVLAATSALYLCRPNFFGDSDAKSSLLQSNDLPLSQCRHFKRILGLAGLFAIDSFAGGMTMNSFLIHWMVTQYQMTERILGTLLAASSVITTPSLWVAAWLGNRIGLINTMVFTHLPANVGLIVLPFMPTAEFVCVIVLFRALLSQMDVPARDTFMTSVVDPEERVACSSFIATARGMACIAGPLVAAVLWQRCGAGAPLILGGILKCMYDISLLLAFRSVRLVESTVAGSE